MSSQNQNSDTCGLDYEFIDLRDIPEDKRTDWDRELLRRGWLWTHRRRQAAA